MFFTGSEKHVALGWGGALPGGLQCFCLGLPLTVPPTEIANLGTPFSGEGTGYVFGASFSLLDD